MKVLFMTRKWPPAIGGMETYSVRLSAELAARTPLDILALPGRGNGSPPRLIRLLGFMLRAFVVVLRRRSDVVHIADLVLWPLGWAAMIRHPSQRLVITAYGLDLVFGRRRGVLSRVYRHYLACGIRLVGEAACIIAISEATAALCRESGFTNVVVVTLGVDCPEAVAPVVQTGQPFVLFVGRLVRRKGAAWFATEVLPLLQRGVRLVVVGKPWEKQEIATLLGNDRVDYREFVSDAELSRLRAAALVVIMPNIPTNGLDVEGFGLTALEAAADGGVLLASGIEGIVDAVIDGVTGFLLPAGDATRWASMVTQVATWSEERRHSYIQGARAAVASRYSWSSVAERTLEVYRGT